MDGWQLAFGWRCTVRALCLFALLGIEVGVEGEEEEEEEKRRREEKTCMKCWRGEGGDGTGLLVGNRG